MDVQASEFFIGIGSNLGDRSGSIAQAIQGLRRFVDIHAQSAIYETEPVNVEGPAFLNTVLHIRTMLDRMQLRHHLSDLEQRLGRARITDRQARPIDLDLLDLHNIAAQPYYLVPAAEIAGDIRDERTQQTLRELAAQVAPNSAKRRPRSVKFLADRQSGNPEVALALDRVGVSRISRRLTLLIDGKPQEITATLALTADLASDRAGVHMSRFSEHIEAVTVESAASSVPQPLDDILRTMVDEIASAQHAAHAHIQLRAPFALERWTPVSGQRVTEYYTLLAHAYHAPHGTRCVIGVEVEGMTACPCAQMMMHEQGLRDLAAAGFPPDDAQRALAALPAATHNQRGKGRLLIGLHGSFEPIVSLNDLVEIIEQSMSSETYELLKRPDEFFVVNKAHRNPRFVEDVVRGIVYRACELYSDLPSDTFFEAAQTNDESIHKHDAIALAHGTLGEFQRELAGAPMQPRSDLETWLRGRG